MANTARRYKGWLLVNVSQNHYVASKGTERLPVGAVRHGDFDGMIKRFHQVVDKREASL